MAEIMKYIGNLPNFLQTVVVIEAITKGFNVHLTTLNTLDMHEAHIYFVGEHQVVSSSFTPDQIQNFVLQIIYSHKGVNDTLVFIVGEGCGSMIRTDGIVEPEVTIMFKWFP